MTIEEDVDELLRNKVKHITFKRNKTITVIGVLIVTLIFLFSAIVPVDYTDISLASLESKIDKSILDVGDEPLNGSAYHYWYAPENSFGTQEIKTVNDSYFKQLFNAHTDWMLEYKRYEWSDWTDGLDYLTIEKTWNTTGFWKFNLIFDVPVHVYSARFTFGVDLSVLQYVERSGYEVWINYTANATENYSVYFNYSDIANIPGLVITKGKTNNMFWFRFRRDDIPAGHYEFDPTFGYEVGEVTDLTLGGSYQGLWGEATGGDGTTDNITVYLRRSTDSGYYWVGCALYEYVDYSSVYAGNKIAESEKRYLLLDTTPTWYAFTITANIVNNTKYYMFATVNNTGTQPKLRGTSGVSGISVYDTTNYGWTPWEDPMVEESTSDYARSIYCSYTVSGGNNAPTQSAQKIWNATTKVEKNLNATGVDLTPTSFNITINDADGDNMNITIMRNNSGVWEIVNQTSGSGLSNGTYNFTNTSWIDTQATQYNITFNVTDGTDWINESYNFTTLWTNSAPVLSTPYPTNQSIDIARWTQLNITVTDSDANHTLNVYIYTNNTGGGQWYLMQSNISVASGTVVRDMNYSNASAYSTKYWWKVACNDSFANTTAIYEFTTEAEVWSNTAPTLTSESPINGSTAQSRFPTLSVVVTDADGNNSAIDWYYLDGAVWYHLQHNASILNATTRIMNFTNASAYSTTYYWKVHANDGHDNISEIYHFTTEGDYIELDPGTTFLVGNENYTNNVTLYLSQILINDTWIMFNGTGFYVDSPSSILFRIMYINSNIAGAGNGDTVLEFWTENGTGNVWYNISGFPVDTNYQINRNGSSYTTDQSNATGNITFNCSLGVLSHWEIIVSSTGPTITGENPTDGATGISLQPVCNVTVNDSEGDTINVTFASDYSGSWQNYQTNSSVGNGSYSWNFTGANSYSTTYNWRVYADDGTTNNSDTYSFTTISTNTAPVATNDAYNVDEADILSIDNISGVLANDNDTDGDNLTAILVNDVNQGNLTLNSDGSFIYKAPVDFSGIVTFTYYANDSTENSNLATVYIYVTQASRTPWDNTMLCYQRIWTKDDKGQIVIVYSGGRIKRITGYDSIIVIGMDDIKKFEGLLFLYG